MTFNLVQTVFALNMAANAVAGIDDTPQNLQSLFSAYLNGGPLPSPYGVYEPNTDTFTTTAPGFFNSLDGSLLGDWEVVWGPAVYVDLAKNMTTGEATNSAFVAKSVSNNAYVVAIAGTNFKSVEDWLAEDVSVDPAQRVAWTDFNPAGLQILTEQEKDNPIRAMIDAGSALGVSNLVTQLTDPNQQQADMRTLAGFLRQLPSTDGYLQGSTLYFTGHSLGGALTQVIALYLFAQLEANGWAKIRTLPTAGPTPGNLGFQILYDHTFKPGFDPTGFAAVPNWSADVISSGDVVPAAWNNLTSAFTLNVDQAGNYASFYGELSPNPIDFKILWLNFEVKKAPFGKVMGDLMLAITAFVGEFYWPVFQTAFTPTPGFYQRTDGYVTWQPFPLATDADPILDLKALGPYVLHAHTSQYNYYFGIGVVPQFPTVQGG